MFDLIRKLRDKIFSDKARIIPFLPFIFSKTCLDGFRDCAYGFNEFHFYLNT